LIASYSFQLQADATALDDRLQFIEQAVDLFWCVWGPKAQGPSDPSELQKDSFKANWAILGATAVPEIIPKLALLTTPSTE
jgi:hypothetical protein